MQDFNTSSENISATLAAARSVRLIKGVHYLLAYYPDHGWEWEGHGQFSGQCCEYPYFSEADAETAALTALS